ncbi:autotransporter outer membrane beta-barrel domain-containing protein [Ochrobactrum sp. Q0168]|uniref:autotransporter domain-containing protein n=1 Tax=Ochrobactrum sp. Q0168 TaxID=2793241 RepID=UPI0018EACC9A|nr:autotransporter outer membrane beta-barrel domain-containing protein [Ochrobactrum sp. Q0168]
MDNSIHSAASVFFTTPRSLDKNRFNNRLLNGTALLPMRSALRLASVAVASGLTLTTASAQMITQGGGNGGFGSTPAGYTTTGIGRGGFASGGGGSGSGVVITNGCCDIYVLLGGYGGDAAQITGLDLEAAGKNGNAGGVVDPVTRSLTAINNYGTAAPIGGAGGGGGGLLLSTDTSLIGNYGGNGGSSASGLNNAGTPLALPNSSGGGGGGGNGHYEIISTYATISGPTPFNGSNGGDAYWNGIDIDPELAGGGGGGGVGLALIVDRDTVPIAVTINSDATITGGAGGTGVRGGDGGAGLFYYFDRVDDSFVNYGKITGGRGGISLRSNLAGGNGAAGLLMNLNGTATNKGTIIGGDAGQGYPGALNGAGLELYGSGTFNNEGTIRGGDPMISASWSGLDVVIRSGSNNGSFINRPLGVIGDYLSQTAVQIDSNSYDFTNYGRIIGDVIIAGSNVGFTNNGRINGTVYITGEDSFVNEYLIVFNNTNYNVSAQESHLTLFQLTDVTLHTRDYNLDISNTKRFSNIAIIGSPLGELTINGDFVASPTPNRTFIYSANIKAEAFSTWSAPLALYSTTIDFDVPTTATVASNLFAAIDTKLIKSGVGSLLFDSEPAQGTYETQVKEGTLTFSPRFKLGGNVDIQQGAKLILESTTLDVRTINTVISGDGSVTIDQSSGGQTDFTVNQQYTGDTVVKGGSVSLNNATLQSGTMSLAGATMSGRGTVNNLVLNNSSLDNRSTSLNIRGDLTLTDSAINFYIAQNNGTAPTQRLTVDGDVNFNGSNQLNISSLDPLGLLPIGYYRLFDYGGNFQRSNFTVNVTGLTDPHQLVYGQDYVDFVVGTIGSTNQLQTWAGSSSWTASSMNWLNDGGNVPVVWGGNHAVFKEPSAGTTHSITIDDQIAFNSLQFVDEGFSLDAGSGALVLDGNLPNGLAEVRVLADVATINAQITGNGGLAKTEAGTLVLTGNNTYTGGTTIYNGAIQITDEGNLGAGALTLDGGNLNMIADMTGGRTITVASIGALSVAHNAQVTWTGAIDGAGTLAKDGAGSLSLGAANSYAGGTLLRGGKLIITADNNLGDASGWLTFAGGELDIGASMTSNRNVNVATEGTLAIDDGYQVRWNGQINGSGTLTKTGNGALTLGGISSANWNIQNGLVETIASNLRGNAAIQTDGTLIFDQPEDGDYYGQISGNGHLIKNGAGKLTVAGDSSAFSGLLIVAGGELDTGTNKGRGSIGGDMLIASGAKLSGVGTIGSGANSTITVSDQAILAPGNSIGTLTVNGNLVLEQGSIYNVEVDPSGPDSDVMNVTGNVTINGAAVAHIGYSGEYALHSVYTILKADGALTGAFSTVTSEFAFLNPTLLYDYGKGTVSLELNRNDIRFADMGTTRNQVAVATAVEALGSDHAIYGAVSGLPNNKTAIGYALDNLSGEIYGSIASALIEDSAYIRDIANNRMRAALGGIAMPKDGTEAPLDSKWSGWAAAYGGWNKIDGNGNYADVRHSAGGFVVGADTKLESDWLVGALAGYGITSIKADNRQSSTSVDSFHVGAYAARQWDHIALRAGIANSWHQIDTDRNVGFVGLGPETLTGDGSARTFQIFGELAYKIDTRHMMFEPYANLAYINHHMNGYDETGGEAALHGYSSNTNATFGTVGLRAKSAIQITTATTANVTAGIGYRKASNGINGNARHSFDGGEAFSITGAPIAKDAAILEAGLEIPVSRQSNFNVNYQAQLGAKSTQHTLGAKFSLNF